MTIHSSERFLVTGALGCIGAWTVKRLVAEGVPVVTFDKAGDAKRLRLIMDEAELAAVTMKTGDITDLAAIERALDEHEITNMIHLAALQVPFAKADPARGALVNVVGTVNVFEAAKRRRARIGGVVYAGSIGMFDSADADEGDGRLHVDADAHPGTHYGVYKLANEGNARVYWQDDGLSSVALRPMVVYGPGRDQGLTSGPTRAILAALVGRSFEIGFGGRMLFQYAADVARAFVAASRTQRRGALVYNLGGTPAAVDEFIAAIGRAIPGAAGLITHAADPLPFPEEIESSSMADLGDIGVTPLDEAIVQTVAIFSERLARGELDPDEHGLAP